MTVEANVLWRRKEVLVPDTLLPLLMSGGKMSVAEAEVAAIASGDYRVDRRYQVSIDGGETWHECPKDAVLCPLVDVDGNTVPPDSPIQRNGRPSDAARARVEQALRDAPVQAQPIQYPSEKPAFPADATGSQQYAPGRHTRRTKK